jgi:hypothetical protein
MVAVAIVGGAVASGVASTVASGNNKKAIGKATDSSLQANRESIAAQERIAAQQIAASKEALDKSLGYQTGAFNMGSALQADTYNSSGRMGADIYNQRQAIMTPWAKGGFGAFNQLNSMLGLEQQKFVAPSPIAFSPITAQQMPVAPPPAAATPAPGTPPVPVPGATPAPAAVLPPQQQAGRIADLVRSAAYQALPPTERRAARDAVRG